MSKRGLKAAAGAAGLVLSVGLAMPAHATNGYFPSGYDAVQKGMAGTGLTLAESATSATDNPALGVDEGTSIGGGLDLFMPRRTSTVGTGAYKGTSKAGYDVNYGNAGQFTSADKMFLIPSFGVNYQIDSKSAVGLLIYANGGMDTKYNTNPFDGTNNTAGMQLMQVFISPNYARKLGHGVDIGIAPVIAIQRLSAYGLQAFESLSSNASKVTNNGQDYSYGGGFKIGATYKPTNWLKAGLTYESEMWMTPFSKYAGLLAQHGTMDIAPALSGGIDLKPIKTVDLLLEDEYIFYSVVPAEANSGQASGQLGTNNGRGFGWRDMNVIRVGVQWQATPKLALRAGYSHAGKWINGGTDAEFNILMPATIQDHASIGATYNITPHWSVTGAWQHAFSNSLTGTALFDTAQSVKLEMSQDEASLGVNYKW